MVPAIEGIRIVVEKYDVFGALLSRLFMLINVVQINFLKKTVFVPQTPFLEQLFVIFVEILNLEPAMQSG